MKKITVALIGAGLRGVNYLRYALQHPHEIKVVAVAEPNGERRENFKERHGLSDEMCFYDWDDLFAQPQLADAVLICTQDKQHFEPVMKALKAGYHVLLEKPMSTDPKECVEMGELAAQYNRIFSVCHVLRYTDFFSTIKRLLDSNVIGKLMSIQHNENVGHWHQAHSYVRGNWRRKDESSPMILSKSSHDMDILYWLTGSSCTRVSSFGSLSHFTSAQAPDGAPLRCLDGCPAADECLYYAPKQYLTENTDWPTSAISNDSSYESRLKALQEGPYGRCVYHCDNDVVDHQVVNLEFENGVMAGFAMNAFTKDISRTIKLMGTTGEIRGAMEKNEIEILHFGSSKVERITFEEVDGLAGHGGGDMGLMKDFVKLVREGSSGQGLTTASTSVQSHLMAFAVEKSREEHRVIELKEFEESLRQT
ncbi:Gfo/Idh/MocA family protein [Paenibacillus macquariensis]|uniref:Oxidoreductase family, C-terminal alpha/beta domain n=1 Tax=Paenibacillus macquariensis TaxID=948756 RepID=A0ABY1KDC5_9BACL|nr:Gfo/Idh/MocA family oxidoreductase [Paenibacillus macquariensis]MEC0091917.1 Gfo/Idh/MocA family oxidoreductase [Paenibacillus macquariensis]OAB24985.1 oxidoreductase [Paenibacillus macquariensis subsp. macquariensis]SIR65244.1 Oxidoreductase family, C-terminal alpha/beta domain [Paenibacillus macquariensis]